MAWPSSTARATKRRSSFRPIRHAIANLCALHHKLGAVRDVDASRMVAITVKEADTVPRFRNFLKSVIGFYPPTQILMFYGVRILPYIYGRPLRKTCLVSVAKQAKAATQLGRWCDWSLFEPAIASHSESAAQTTGLQEFTPNVTVGNAVSVLLHDKGKPLGMPFLFREKNRAPLPSCKRRSFVNQCSISTHETGRALPRFVL